MLEKLVEITDGADAETTPHNGEPPISHDPEKTDPKALKSPSVEERAREFIRSGAERARELGLLRGEAGPK